MKKILILSALTILVATGCSLNFPQTKTKTLSSEEAKTKVTDFINNNLMQPGTKVSIKEITEDGDLYKVVVNMPNGQEITSYISKDGKKFFPQVMEIDEIEGKAKENSNSASAGDAPKTDKPKVELFVMAFCPYGVIAEKAMGPAYDLLKDKADINVRYIASIEGDDISKVKSLHGPIEGTEDARQLCILKNYDKDTLWKYITDLDENCYPIYRKGDEVYKECYTKSAKQAGIDINKVDECVLKEGPSLIKEQDKISKDYGVSGSPTIIINGTKVNPARNPEGFKTAICNAFNEQPEECKTVLSTEGSKSAGGCN